MNHGGKRPGAGRKPRIEPREAFTIRVEPEDAKEFKAICKGNKRSQSQQLTVWIKGDLKKQAFNAALRCKAELLGRKADKPRSAEI